MHAPMLKVKAKILSATSSTSTVVIGLAHFGEKQLSPTVVSLHYLSTGTLSWVKNRQDSPHSCGTNRRTLWDVGRGVYEPVSNIDHSRPWRSAVLEYW